MSERHSNYGKWATNIPRKGWECTDIEDLGSLSETCEMCEHQEIRYVHYMKHPDYPKPLASVVYAPEEWKKIMFVHNCVNEP